MPFFAYFHKFLFAARFFYKTAKNEGAASATPSCVLFLLVSFFAVDVVTDHRKTFDAKAESKARNGFGIVADVLEDGGTQTVEKFLLGRYAWLSPLMSREMAYRTTGSTTTHMSQLDEAGRIALYHTVSSLLEEIRADKCAPWMIYEKKITEGGREMTKPVDFSYVPIRQFGNLRYCEKKETFSALLDEFYTQRDAIEHMMQKSQAVRKAVSSTRSKIAKKIASQHAELAAAQDRDSLRRCGDLITGSLHLAEKGMTKANFPDYASYPDEDGNYPMVEVKLNPTLSAQQNAQWYYKQYRRARNAETVLKDMIASGEREVVYLDSVLDELTRAATVAELTEIKRELAANGYVSQKWAETGRRGKERDTGLKPFEYTSSGGFTILAGRNNRQNEQITLRQAMKNDLWFHVQKAAGSHVVLFCPPGSEPDNRTLEEAAMIAAFHSSCGVAEHIPVDYTRIKYVHRQPDGKTGMVLYTNYKTIYITPDEAHIQSLLKKEK